MSNTIQDSSVYTANISDWSATDSSLLATPVEVAFDVLPSVLVSDQLVSAVIDDLIQDIAEEEAVSQGQPLSEDEQVLHELLNMSRQWIAMSVIQQVYESNMRVLRSMSGVKSEGNNFLSRSDDYVTNPFISLSLIDEMNSGDYGVGDTIFSQDNSDGMGNGQGGEITEQEMYDQLLQTLTQQWLDLQDGQTAWQGLSNGLDSLVYNNALTNTRVNNQNTSLSAQVNGFDVQSVLTTLQNLL